MSEDDEAAAFRAEAERLFPGITQAYRSMFERGVTLNQDTMKELTMNTTDTKSTTTNARIQNWKQDETLCAHGIKDFEAANSIRELTINTLKQSHGKTWDKHYQVKVRKYPLHAIGSRPITFSVLVFKAIGNPTGAKP